jgi:hypothetical protein
MSEIIKTTPSIASDRWQDKGCGSGKQIKLALKDWLPT